MFAGRLAARNHLQLMVVIYGFIVFFFKTTTSMSKKYFSVILEGGCIEQLLSLIHFGRHGKFLVGASVFDKLKGIKNEKITGVEVVAKMVTVVILGTKQHFIGSFLDATMTLNEHAVKGLSECTPELKAFFNYHLREKRNIPTCKKIDAHEQQKRQVLKSRVLDYAAGGELNLARETYDEHCAAWWPLADYDLALLTEGQVRTFVALLKDGPLNEIDQFYIEHLRGQLSEQELAILKLPLLKRRLKKLDLSTDAEQERAIASPCQKIQITARAGSGKTSTLAARTAISIDDEKINPNQILILAFNKAAASEIKARVRKLLGSDIYTNARTFHSLAHQLVKPEKKILFDQGGSVSESEQSQFAQRMLRRILNPAFQEEVVRFFRQEMTQIESIGRDLLPMDYYIFRHSLEHVTLGGQWVRDDGQKVRTNGERVKSNGEKFIADFLFEYDIPYRYEKAWIWKTPFLDGITYKPDFSIVANGQDYIIEHWAFDPNDLHAELPAHWGQTTIQYRQQIHDKRQFWASKQITLLETNSGMLATGRQAFEKQLRLILEQAGINCTRLAETEIIKRVFQNDFIISRMAKLFIQFIQRAKKRAWSPDKVSQMLIESKENEPRTNSFHRLALRAYREYELMKNEESALDFDDLLLEAKNTVELKGENATIHLGAGQTITLGDISWILLDEYQDFSWLNFQMIDSILKVCPNIRVVAVGDDWQAINSFAGAELEFFERFSKYFPDGETVGLTTNYRSDRDIVAAGNRLMSGHGQPAMAKHLVNHGAIDIFMLSQVFVQFVRTPATEAEWQKDQSYLPKGTDGRASEAILRQAQALKKCVQILKRALEVPAILNTELTADRHPYALLLSRTGYAYGLKLPEFKTLLVNILANLTNAAPELLNRLIQTMTAHGSKGREAHTVIILDATERHFPKIHPDNLLFEIFGTTLKNILDEERRLFYVAISRAKHRLVILTEQGRESPYLQLLRQSDAVKVTPNRPTVEKIKSMPAGPLAQRIQELLPAEERYSGFNRFECEPGWEPPF